MSLEIRRVGKCSYFTQTHREGAKIVKTHVGTTKSPFVAFAFRSACLAKTKEKNRCRQLAEERSRNVVIERQVKFLMNILSCLRVLEEINTQADQSTIPPQTKDKPMDDIEVDAPSVADYVDSLPKLHELGRIRQAANAGDEDAKAEIDRLTKIAPELVRDLFDPIKATRDSVIEELSGGDYLHKQSLSLMIDQNVEQMLEKVNESDALQRMASEVVAITWLETIRCRALAARTHERKGDATYFESLADRAQRRFTRATEIAVKKSSPNHVNDN